MFETLSEDQKANLLDGLAKHQYNLLFGAGASHGALGGDLKPLPMASELTKDLLEAFSVGPEPDATLSTTYEFIVDLEDKNGLDRQEYLKHRFSNCQPTWHSLLSRFNWKRLWTLNIDDVVEQAYAKQNIGQDRQKAKPIIWNQPYCDLNSQDNELQIIHLHGFAPALKANTDNLVFSMLEYLQASLGHHAWHKICADLFYEQPFIIVGARLKEEYDLAEFLRRGSGSEQSTALPSLIVLPSITNMDKKLFQKWNLIPIEAKAEDFFTCLSQELVSSEQTLGVTFAVKPDQKVPQNVISFINQFEPLNVDAKSAKKSQHDFYQGDEPDWDDILRNKDARFEIVDRILSNIHQAPKQGTSHTYQNIHLISGTPGTGKSTALLRIGRELIRRGDKVYLFRGIESLDVKAAVWWLEHEPQSVLLFDGIADFALNVADLALDCEERGLNLRVVATERSRRKHQVFEALPPRFLISNPEYTIEKLSDLDVSALLKKLTDETRLGQLTRVSYQKKQEYFKNDANRQLPVALLNLESTNSSGFLSRLTDEYKNDISNDSLRKLYAMSCMTYNFGYPLPIGIACAATGLTSREVYKAVEAQGELSSIIRLSDKGLKPRHRVIGQNVVEYTLSNNQRFDITQVMLKTLAPYINATTARNLTLQYRIVRNLMNENIISRWIGLDQLRAWYEGISEEYKNNSRFWEQRALAEARLEHLSKARSFAEQAVKINRDLYSLNTLGTILLKMSTVYHTPGSVDAENLFWEGLKILDEACRVGRDGSEYPFTTAFSYILRYTDKAFADQFLDDRFAREWERWYRRAKEANVFMYPETADQLQQHQAAWLKRWATRTPKH